MEGNLKTIEENNSIIVENVCLMKNNKKVTFFFVFYLIGLVLIIIGSIFCSRDQIGLGIFLIIIGILFCDISMMPTIRKKARKEKDYWVRFILMIGDLVCGVLEAPFMMGKFYNDTKSKIYNAVIRNRAIINGTDYIKESLKAIKDEKQIIRDAVAKVKSGEITA